MLYNQGLDQLVLLDVKSVGLSRSLAFHASPSHWEIAFNTNICPWGPKGFRWQNQTTAPIKGEASLPFHAGALRPNSPPLSRYIGEIDAGPLTAPSRGPAQRVRTAVLRLSSWRRGAMCRTLTTAASGPFTVSTRSRPVSHRSKPRPALAGAKAQEGRWGRARCEATRGRTARDARPQPRPRLCAGPALLVPEATAVFALSCQAAPVAPLLGDERYHQVALFQSLPRSPAVFLAGDSRLQRDGGSAFLKGDALVMVGSCYQAEDPGVVLQDVVWCTWRN